LALLVRDNFVKDLETDYDDSTYDANLKKLEKKLEELNEFKSGGKKEVYASLGTDDKKIFDDLITMVVLGAVAYFIKTNSSEEGEVVETNSEGGALVRPPFLPFLKNKKMPSPLVTDKKEKVLAAISEVLGMADKIDI
ncbi:8770_t:CDS:2, partial [Ambispora gerdemannii]